MSKTEKTADLEVGSEIKTSYLIEELKEKNQTPDAVFEGTKAMMKWRPGKQVEEGEYEKAVNLFLGAPAGGR